MNVFRETKKILSVTGRSKEFLLLLLLRAPFDTAFTLINALFLQYAFNAVNQNNPEHLTLTCLRFGLAVLGLFLYNGTLWSIYAPFTTRLEGRLRIKLYEKISSLSWERVEAVSHGEWITRLNTDVEMPFSRPLHFPHAACAIVNLMASSLILWKMNPEAFGWVIWFVIPHIIINQWYIGRAMPVLNRVSLEATARNTADLTALITCADTAALYDAQPYLMARFENSSRALFKANMKIRIKNALSAGLLPLFGLGGYLVLLAAGGQWIADGQLSFGELTAVFQYRGGVLMGSMMLINCMISIQSSMAGIRRVNETMSEKTEEIQETEETACG